MIQLFRSSAVGALPIAVIACLVTAPLSAEVVRIDVPSRADVVNGQPFGPAGPYEKLSHIGLKEGGEDLMLTGRLLPFPRTGCVLHAKAILPEWP
jgi:hypothetical protein